MDAEIPNDIRLMLTARMATLKSIQEVMLLQGDQAHKLAHVLDVLAIFNCLAEADNLDPVERDLGQRTIRLHDTGRKLVEKGWLEPNEHHFGSMMIASIVDPDPRVLEGIRHHIDDILPESIELWIRLVRDADRISALGFSGANRSAWFFGFRDIRLYAQEQEGAIRSGKLCDLRHAPEAYKCLGFSYPLLEDYDLKAARYFAKKVAPYIHLSGQDRAFYDYLGVFEQRHHGLRDGGRLVVEPVAEKAREMYHLRDWATDTIRTQLFDMFSGGSLTGYSENGESQIDYGWCLPVIYSFLRKDWGKSRLRNS